MGAIIIKIESTYVSLAQTKRIDGKAYISMMRRTVLPDRFLTEDITAHPEELAGYIIASIINCGMPGKKLAIYLGAGTERFAEYKYSEAINKETLEKRKEQAEFALLEDNLKDPFRIRHYSYSVIDDGLVANAVLAANEEFCTRLLAAFTEAGYSVIALSSSLTAFAEIASLFANMGERVLVINAEKKELYAALFVKDRLSYLKRISQGTEDKDPLELVRGLITSDTKVLLSGFEAQNATFHEKLRRAGTEDVIVVDSKINKVYENVILSGELANQDAVFPGVFSAITFIRGAPHPFDSPPLSYFSKDSGIKRQYISVFAICAAAVAIAIFICSVPPVMLANAEREHAANTKRLEEPFFTGARESLTEYRSLVSEYTELMKMEELKESPDPSYARIVNELNEDLLKNANIEEIYYEKSHGLLVDFTTEDAAGFEQAKNRINDSRKMSIYEPNEREEITEDEWRIQIRITLTPSAWEASQQ